MLLDGFGVLFKYNLTIFLVGLQQFWHKIGFGSLIYMHRVLTYLGGEVSVAETEIPDRDPRTQIAHTIIYSRNVFSTVMAGAHVRTAALVMTYFAHEYSTACHFEFAEFSSFFFSKF